MEAMRGDFLGFTFGDLNSNFWHSSELGITRISEGSRYSENLLPSTKDETVSVSGVDGVYYFGSTNEQVSFNFPIAFDNMSEIQLRKLKTIFNDKKIHSLIFDETPYKVYKVKATGNPNLKYVCFDVPKEAYAREDDDIEEEKDRDYLYGTRMRPRGNRVYRGEGQLSFTAYNPYAKSRYKYLDEYTSNNIPEWGMMNNVSLGNIYYNLYDWIDSVNLVKSNAQKKHNEVYYTIDEVNTNGVMVYNPGDLATNFILKINFLNSFDKFQIGQIGSSWGYLKIENLILRAEDSGIQINTALNLIEGIDSNGEVTGNVYNKNRVGGDFFKIPLTEELKWLPIYWSDGAPSDLAASIEYDYLYY